MTPRLVEVLPDLRLPLVKFDVLDFPTHELRENPKVTGNDA